MDLAVTTWCVCQSVSTVKLAADRAPAVLSLPKLPWSARKGYSHAALFAPLEV